MHVREGAQSASERKFCIVDAGSSKQACVAAPAATAGQPTATPAAVRRAQSQRA